MSKIDPITQYILEADNDLDTLLEGYDLKCKECGRVITIVKDGQGSLACCNRRMFVMGSQAEPQDVEGEQMGEGLGGHRDAARMFAAAKRREQGTSRISSFNKMMDTHDKKMRTGEVPRPKKGITANESEFIRDMRETFDEALASADPTSEERKDFEEGLRKILGGEIVKPDFMLPLKSVNFTPDNQADVQKQRDSKKKVEELKSVGGWKKVGKMLNPLYHQRRGELLKQRKIGLQGRKQWNKKYAGGTAITYDRDTGETVARRKLGTMSGERGNVNYKAGDPLHRFMKTRAAKQKRVKREKGRWMPDSEFHPRKESLHLDEAGFETKPKGWTNKSVKKFGHSLVKGGGKKKGFFDKCVKKMADKMENPEGFCASVKDEAHDSTYWRGKDKTPQQAGKDVKKHKNV